MIKELDITTRQKNEFIDITEEINLLLVGIKEGICIIYVPHTTAALTINENADPDVTDDILKHLSKMVPDSSGYKHSEGNSSAHIKSSIVGCSQTAIIKNGKLLLGSWQGVMFCEFDGPRQRKVIVKVVEK